MNPKNMASIFVLTFLLTTIAASPSMLANLPFQDPLHKFEDMPMVGNTEDPSDVATGAAELQPDYYHKLCPQAEELIRNLTWTVAKNDSALGAKLLRLSFHDCFVRGCDASVLLDTVGPISTEKDAVPNLSLGRLEVIDFIKPRVELMCPGTVSCADIIALSARDAVSFPFQRPMWSVLTGRRDGRVSIESEANNNLPSPVSRFADLQSIFLKKGLSIRDLVALSGAHTIGVAHFGATLVEMDPGSSLSFDNHYYTVVAQGRGLFSSDAALMENPESVGIVKRLQSSNDAFFSEFAAAMTNMAGIDVKTGSDGEIRKLCRVVN